MSTRPETDMTLSLIKLLIMDPAEAKNVRYVARPVLSEPFWNEGVIISEALMKTYQMDEQDPEKVLKKDLERLKNMNQSDVVEDQLKELKGFIDTVDEFDVLNLFAENEEDDEDETETTSPDEGEKEDYHKKKKKIKGIRKLEKLNIFMEENAPFPESTSPTKFYDSEPKISPSKIATERANEEQKEKKEPSNLAEAFKLTVAKDGVSKVTLEDLKTFSSSRPQETKFQYGKGMETNSVTRSIEHGKDGKDQPGPSRGNKKSPNSPNTRPKDSTDETTSSEEMLRTSSSVKSSSDDHDQNKRKKGSSSPLSAGSSTCKRDDKKLRFGSSDSDTVGAEKKRSEPESEGDKMSTE